MKDMYKLINNMILEVNTLNDEVEQNIRLELIDNITMSVNDYRFHLNDYERKQKINNLLSLGVKFTEQKSGASVKGKWSKIFTSEVSDQAKKEVGYDAFRWHVFSFGLIKSIEGEAARVKFDQVEKNSVYVFYQNKNEAYKVDNPEHLSAADFDLEQDIYVYDDVGRWTYVFTHEESCGPYFYTALEKKPCIFNM